MLAKTFDAVFQNEFVLGSPVKQIEYDPWHVAFGKRPKIRNAGNSFQRHTFPPTSFRNPNLLPGVEPWSGFFNGVVRYPQDRHETTTISSPLNGISKRYAIDQECDQNGH